MDRITTSHEQIIERAKELAAQEPNMLLAYLAALQEQLLNRLDSLALQLQRIASQADRRPSVQETPMPTASEPVEHEYTSVTVRTGILFSDDKAVNKKINEMAAQGWELVSNTEARGTALSPPGRMLQFRRPKQRRRRSKR